MDKDEIKKIVLDAIESGAIQYTLETCNTGDCKLYIGPIYFKREIPQPELDPDEPKYIIVRGNESQKWRERIKKKYGGNVEFLPSCTEITPFGKWTSELHINGQIIRCDNRNILMG